MPVSTAVPPGSTDYAEAARPIGATERLTPLDTLRGFALLGILLMNIVGFAFYHEAYDNPTAAGGSTGINLWLWFFLHVVAEGKMRCLFSLVFGASVILLTSRMEGRPDAADIYYRRTLWLLLFGIVHSFLLWQGEILYPYAICSFALYPFRRLKPRGLIVLAAVLVVYCGTFYSIQAWTTQGKIESGRAAVAKAERGGKLTVDEQEARLEWEKLVKGRNPGPEALEKDAAEWRGNPLQVIQARGAVVLLWTSVPWYHAWNMDILSMMLLGMAMMKLGVLGGGKSVSFHAALATAGYGIGLPLHTLNGWAIIQSNFNPVTQGYAGAVYDLGRFTVACGHVGLVLLLCQVEAFRWLTDRLAAVGQMALTNYLTHSVVCALVFTGYGAGLYGRLERYQAYYVVLALWLFQLIVSPMWLRRFRFGPAERCWRSLTY